MMNLLKMSSNVELITSICWVSNHCSCKQTNESKKLEHINFISEERQNLWIACLFNNFRPFHFVFIGIHEKKKLLHSSNHVALKLSFALCMQKIMAKSFMSALNRKGEKTIPSTHWTCACSWSLFHYSWLFFFILCCMPKCNL